MTRLSNRQHPMLKAFADHGCNWHMPIEAAQHYDQRPFRSMLVQQWIAYTPGKGFHLTRKGKDAWDEFQRTDIFRKDPTQPLTKLFDPSAYLRKSAA